MSAVVAIGSQPGLLRQKTFWISHSKLGTYLSCPRKYKFSYVDQLMPEAQPINLLLGSVAHDTLAHYLTTLAFGHAVDPVAEFERRWEQALEAVVDFGSKAPEDVLATGRRLMAIFPETWASMGYRVLMDADGAPIVERELSFMLPDDIKVTVILDLLVENAAGDVLTLDFKFSAQASMEGFSQMSDQLLLQQIAVDANAPMLGLDDRKVAGGLFFEGIKAKVPTKRDAKGPHYIVDAPARRRSDEDVQEWISEARNLVADIRSGRFPKRPMGSFDSPCKLCDYVSACHEKNYAGLIKKPAR